MTGYTFRESNMWLLSQLGKLFKERFCSPGNRKCHFLQRNPFAMEYFVQGSKQKVRKSQKSYSVYKYARSKAYRGLTGGFLLLRIFSVDISVSPHVCFILDLILISIFLRSCINELGIFHANQTTKCLRNQGRTKGEGWSTQTR